MLHKALIEYQVQWLEDKAKHILIVYPKIFFSTGNSHWNNLPKAAVGFPRRCYQSLVVPKDEFYLEHKLNKGSPTVSVTQEVKRDDNQSLLVL